MAMQSQASAPVDAAERAGAAAAELAVAGVALAAGAEAVVDVAEAAARLSCLAVESQIRPAGYYAVAARSAVDAH